MARTEDRLCFLDTNVLLAATDESRKRHGQSLALLEKGLSGEQSLFVSGQVLREYLVVATRPVEANGLGLSPGEALENVAEFHRCVSLLEETNRVSESLRKLVNKHQLSGKRIHDANIVAVMLANGLKKLATDNGGDFEVFTEVTVGW